jgi:hypothetical protein
VSKQLSLKPIHYNLEVCFGGFDGDSVGWDSSTPFMPLGVGDFIDRSIADFGGPGLQSDEEYRVIAVKHNFQDFDSHILQYVRICVEVGKP